MRYEKRSESTQTFAETPLGIVSTNRNWYHTTSDAIQEYIPGLLEKKPLDELIPEAEAWVKSPDTTALLMYLVLVFILPGWLAAVLSLCWFGFWYLNKSAFVSPALTPVLKLVNNEVLIMGSSLLIFSYLGIEGFYVEAILGFILYLILKVGLLRLGTEYLMDKSSSNSMPANDRVLKMLLVKYGRTYDLPVPEVDALERDIVDLVSKHKNK